MNSGIYEIRNTVNGKRYIGSTARLSVRFLQHRSKLRQGKHHSPPLQAAWNKYGEDAFEYRTVLHCPRDVLIAEEQKLFDELRAAGEVIYNVAEFACSGAKGRVPTSETRAKQRESVKATYAARSPKEKAQHSATLKATWTPERRAAYAAKRKALWEAKSEEEKDRIRTARKAGRERPESIAKRNAGTRALFQDPEFVAKQRAASAEAARRPETRAKHAANLAARNRAKWNDPAERARLTALMTESAASDKGRQRRAELMTARWADKEEAERIRQSILEGISNTKVLKSC